MMFVAQFVHWQQLPGFGDRSRVLSYHGCLLFHPTHHPLVAFFLPSLLPWLVQALRIVSPLEVLLLGFNKVSNVDGLGLQQFPRLRVLHLQSNNLTSLHGLSACPSLRELVLNKNRIRQLEADSLAGLPNLHELHMQENGVRSLVHFGGLSSLQSLHLGYNRVNDVQDLHHLSELHQLVNIAMNNNPVARRQLYRPTLLCQVVNLRWIDGREASFEERERAETLLKSDAKPLKFYLVGLVSPLVSYSFS